MDTLNIAVSSVCGIAVPVISTIQFNSGLLELNTIQVKTTYSTIQHKTLVDATKIVLPPLHIKLGLTKNFVKALDKEGASFHFLRPKFPKISEAKI